MVPKSHLDDLLEHHSLPCALEETLLKYPAIKRFLSPIFSLLPWLMEMFNPPPLESMTFSQKTGRVVFFSAMLVIASVLFAMAAAVGLYLLERARELHDTPGFYHGVVIVMFGVAVNAFCVFVLLQIKKADTKLLPPDKK
jgi:hypothetical protein